MNEGMKSLMNDVFWSKMAHAVLFKLCQNKRVKYDW